MKPLIPFDVIGILFEFIPPPQLLAFATCCKYLKEYLTYKQVIASCLYRGGKNSRESLKLLMDLLRPGCIYTPTPLRILRIVNGKTCEIKGCNGKLNILRPDWGVFACWTCTKARSTQVKRAVFQSMFDSPRTARWKKSGGHVQYLWTKPYTAADGELCGPCITVTMGSKMTPALLDELNESAPMISPDILAYYDRTVEASEQHHRAVAVQQEQARAARKVAKENKAIVVKANFFAQFDSSADYFPLVQSSAVVASKLEPFLAAPSKATKTAIKALAEEVRALIEPLPAFLSLSFLDGDDHPLMVTLRDCASRWDMKNLALKGSDRITLYVLRLVQAGHQIAALVEMIGHYEVVRRYYAMHMLAYAQGMFHSVFERCDLWTGVIEIDHPNIAQLVPLMKQSFEQCALKLEEMSLLMTTFLSLKWLGDEAEAKAAEIQKDDVMSSLFDRERIGETMADAAIDCLEKGDFVALLSEVQATRDAEVERANRYIRYDDDGDY